MGTSVASPTAAGCEGAAAPYLALSRGPYWKGGTQQVYFLDGSSRTTNQRKRNLTPYIKIRYIV